MTANSTDSESGIASYTFPNLGTGWAASGSGDTRTYTWSAATPATITTALTVTATNNAGQTSSGSNTTNPITMRADTTAPVVPVPSVASGYVTVLSVPVGLGTVTDTGGSGVNASTVTVLRASATLSAGTCGTFSSFAPVTLTGGNDTTVLSGLCYQYQQRATDNVGNTTTSTPSNAVKVDNTAPASAVTFPVASGSYNNTSWTAGCTAKLCGTASDTGSGVAQVQVSVQSNTGTTSGKYWNGTAFASATEVKSPASLAGGTWTLAFPSTNFPADGSTYTVRAYATDTAGNTQTTPTTTFTIDNTAPTSAVTFPVASGSYNNTSWTAGCTAKLCGTASDTGSGVAQVQVSVQSNTGTTSGKYWNGTAFASATEVKSPASLAGGTWTLAFPSTNFPADGSTYTVRAYATDTAGNTQTTPTTTFTIDNTAPTSAVTFPVASGSYNNTSWTAGCTAKLCGTASDTGSGVAQVQVSVQSNTGTTSGKYWNGTAFASATEVKSPASLAGGTWTLAFPSTNFPADGSTYTVRAYATDTAGNTQTTPTTTFTIDANAPTITGLTLAGGAARKIEWGDKITITFSEQMRASSLCSSWTTGTDSDTRTLSSNVSVAIGNGTAPVTGNDYLTVTATGCSFGTLDLGSGQYVTGPVTFTNTGGNGSTVQWNGSTSTLTITLGKVATGTTRIRASVPDSSPTYGNSSIQDSAGNPLSAPSFTLPSGPQF